MKPPFSRGECLGLVLVVLFVLSSCAGVEVRAEGCYYESGYRVCVSAVRYADGRIEVGLRSDVGELPELPNDVRARALEYGATLVKKPPGE
jgi:hypothetical protein